ncbi:MAG: molybdenum cofactor guanylyltransferase [Mariprofundaceae bacterium]
MIQGVSCVVLLGGESRRMGVDKAHVKLAGHTLVEWVLATVKPLFDDVMISGRVNTPNIGGTRFIKDRLPGRGPAVGLCAAMQAARHPFVFAIACDMPFISARLIQYLAAKREGFDMVVPEIDERLEPLCAVYGLRCLDSLGERVKTGKRGLIAWMEQERTLRLLRVDEQTIRGLDPGLHSFTDIDTADALSDAERSLG